MSPAVTGPGPFLWRRSCVSSRAFRRIATCFRFSRMSTTSSCTPSMEVYSWSTPSISASVIAQPVMDDSSTRRSALPNVWPKPRSNGSITTFACLDVVGVTLTTRGFRNSPTDACMEEIPACETFENCACPPRYSGNTAEPKTRLLRIQLDDEVLVDVGQNLFAVGQLLERAGEFLLVDLDPRRETDLSLDLQGRLNAQLLLRLLADRDHVARLALVGGDGDLLTVHGNCGMAHQLTRFVARGCEAHAIDHVVEPTFQELQERCARSTGTARSLDVVVAELLFKDAVHAAQLLLLAQLHAVVGKTTATLALDAARRHFELALRLERLHATLQEQIRSLTTRQLAFRTEITSHESSSTPAASWAGGSRCAGSA